MRHYYYYASPELLCAILLLRCCLSGQVKNIPFVDPDPPHAMDLLIVRDIMHRRVRCLQHSVNVEEPVTMLRDEHEHNGYVFCFFLSLSLSLFALN